MLPTGDEFEPRRDGWFEHKGVWGEVVVGTVIASPKRTERWEVVATAHGQQVEFGTTMWFKLREQNTGAEWAMPPKRVNLPVTILTQHPSDTETGEVTWPTDSEAIMALVEGLGATLLATRNEVTGEVTCPDYSSGYNHLDEIGQGSLRRGLAEHLRMAHSLNPPDDLGITDLVTVHGQSHNPHWPNIGKGGFPHRHVPEDLSII